MQRPRGRGTEPAKQPSGACEGSPTEVRRRRRGPEEIGAATQRRLLGAFPRSGSSRRACVTPVRYGRRVRADPLLDDLDADQRAAVTSTARAARDPRPGRLGQDPRAHPAHRVPRPRGRRPTPRHVLAVTFTRKAAGELVDRLGRLGVDGASPPARSTRRARAAPPARGRARAGAAAGARPQGAARRAADRRRAARPRPVASTTSSPRSSGPRPA